MKREFLVSAASRRELINRINWIAVGEHPADPFHVMFLAILSLLHSGQDSAGLQWVWHWLVTSGYAREAGEIEIPDFAYDRKRWIVTNIPLEASSII